MAEKAGRVGHYQAGKLTKQNVDGFVQQMAKSTGGQVRRTASMTVAGITKSQPERSNIRYARVLHGLESCGWCFMLASRGFVYRSEEAASHSHRGCKCVVMAGREGDTIEGYDLEGIQERYDKVVEACGYDVFIDKDTRFDQLSREDYDRIAREAGMRSPLWLSKGIVESVSFETESLKESVLQKTPWEAETAARLALHGFDPRILIDYRVKRDSSGVKRRIGLPDLPNGVEMKTPMESRNPFGCVKNYLNNANGKEGLKKIVIDNTVSQFTDKELSEGIARALRSVDFKLPEVTFLGKDGKLHCIWNERDQRPQL